VAFAVGGRGSLSPEVARLVGSTVLPCRTSERWGTRLGGPLGSGFGDPNMFQFSTEESLDLTLTTLLAAKRAFVWSFVEWSPQCRRWIPPS
jgi:hypothetical protein